MKIIFTLAGIALALLAYVFMSMKKRRTVGIIDVDNETVQTEKRVTIDFSHVVFSDSYVRPILDDEVFLIKGKRFSKVDLSDGRKITVKNGDCIVVDRTLVLPDIVRYKLFLVRLENSGGLCLRTADEIIAETPILGTVIARVPRTDIDTLAWK